MNVKPDRLGLMPANERAPVGTRKLALEYMLKALEHLDNDADISPLIGAQLQLAIDRLESTLPAGSRVA